MSMPIYGDMKDVKFQSHPFYPVVESPGVVFIVKKEDSSNAAQAVMEAVFQGWPVLLLTLIMAALSGIVVWALVSKYTLESFSTCYCCQTGWYHLKQFSHAISCMFLCVLRAKTKISSGTTHESIPQNVFCCCSFVPCLVPRFLVFASSSLIQKFFGCFFRIPTGTQKNSLVLSSRVHGKASGGPSFPWLLLGKKMIILHFYFNACIALSLTFPAPPRSEGKGKGNKAVT